MSNAELPPSPMDKPNSATLTPLEKLHSETATIAWRELQRFFAQGSVLVVSDELDLVETALMFAQDNAGQLKPLLDEAKVVAPSNDQARAWYDSDAILWSVVVAPFVLVQNTKPLA